MFSHQNIDRMSGHWLLARLGKRVLRPGGKELTARLLQALRITPADDIVEFAPGIGYTASMALKYRPHSYTGIEVEADIAAALRRKIPHGRIFTASANRTGLGSRVADKVYGEAMLTMQADHRKVEIICEASRILKKGGLYGIHELGLIPDTLDGRMKATIQRDLARVIRVNARPLTCSEWEKLLGENGFKVKEIMTNPMRLLESGRIVHDEGFFRALRIGFNILADNQARKRVLAMRGVFRKYSGHMNAVAIIAEKI